MIIFDGIQNIPRALTSLKYFQDEIPQLAICAAGSLLGVFLGYESFPVGKVEFLQEVEANVLLIEVKSGWVKQARSIKIFAERYNSKYRINI